MAQFFSFQVQEILGIAVEEGEREITKKNLIDICVLGRDLGALLRVASASVHSPKTLGWLPGQQRSGVNPADFAGHPTTVANLREYSFA